jgi:hypothetical protein
VDGRHLAASANALRELPADRRRPLTNSLRPSEHERLFDERPFRAHDALSPDEISAALCDADLASLDRVRFYERRLRDRESVLVEIERLRVPFRRPPQAQSSRPSNWG